MITKQNFLGVLGPAAARAIELAMLSGHNLYIFLEGLRDETDQLKIEKIAADINFIRLMIIQNLPPGFGVEIATRYNINTIWIEIPLPDIRTVLNPERFEPLDDVVKRVAAARQVEIPTDIKEKEEYDTLLRNFYSRVPSLLGVINAQELARHIARLDGSSTIRLEHLAEAIQYQHP